MAITKILYRSGGLAQAIQYITNPDKTDQCVLVDHCNCNPGFASRDEVTRALRMLDRVYELMYGFSK